MEARRLWCAVKAEGRGGRTRPGVGNSVKPDGPSIGDIDGTTSTDVGELRPKFQRPRMPSRALSVEPSPSMEYCPVSCCKCASTDAGGGPELTAGVAVDLLYSESESSVSGLIQIGRAHV